jgi:hypothetical protein
MDERGPYLGSSPIAFRAVSGNQTMASEWFYTLNRKKHGPVSFQELRQLAKAGALLPSDLIWKEGMNDWRPAKQAKQLFEGVQATGALSVPAAPSIAVSAATPKSPDNAAGFVGCLVVMLFVGSCAMLVNGLTPSPKWYEGGTLHQESALAWQVASAEDRLATCADFVFNAHKKGLLKPELSNRITTIDDTRPLAEQLSDCLDKSFAPEPDPARNRLMYANQKVSTLAGVCAVLMNWVNK